MKFRELLDQAGTAKLVNSTIISEESAVLLKTRTVPLDLGINTVDVHSIVILGGRSVMNYPYYFADECSETESLNISNKYVLLKDSVQLLALFYIYFILLSVSNLI
jgi:hypothetical protein